jgi:hypothetical protein
VGRIISWERAVLSAIQVAILVWVMIRTARVATSIVCSSGRIVFHVTPHCSGCFGTTAAECYSCAWPYQNISGVCMCSPIGNYIDGSGVCRSCHASCMTCDGSTATDCLSCYSSQHRGLDVKTCICELPFMDARMLTCVNPCPNGFGSNGTNICDEICGDGKAV